MVINSEKSTLRKLVHVRMMQRRYDTCIQLSKIATNIIKLTYAKRLRSIQANAFIVGFFVRVYLICLIRFSTKNKTKTHVQTVIINVT